MGIEKSPSPPRIHSLQMSCSKTMRTNTGAQSFCCPSPGDAQHSTKRVRCLRVAPDAIRVGEQESRRSLARLRAFDSVPRFDVDGHRHQLSQINIRRSAWDVQNTIVKGGEGTKSTDAQIFTLKGGSRFYVSSSRAGHGHGKAHQLGME